MKAFTAILVLIFAGGVAALLVFFQPEPDETTPERPITGVEVLTAQPEAVQLTVRSQGTILPRTETDLSAEVSGRVISVSEAFRPGGTFKRDEILLKIDPADYEAAVAARTADLAGARLSLAQERALADQAAADWQALGGDAEPSALTLREPQLAQAEALVASAEAALKQAERNLARTRVRAPYEGRVLETSVDLGQYVTANPAAPIGRIYATHSAEVRLPLTEREAAFIDFEADPPPTVRLYNRNTEARPVRTGTLTRMEGTIDPASRLLYAVAEIDDAFRSAGGEQPALRRGQFVEAVIEGRVIEEAYVLPRYALRGSNTVYVVTEAATLVTRETEIVQADAERVILRSGLEPGDRVAISPVAYFIENMPVEVLSAE